MDKQGISRIGTFIIIVFSSLLIAGYGSTEKENSSTDLENNLYNDETNENIFEYKNNELDQGGTSTNNDEESDLEDVPMIDNLEVINNNPIGDYRTSDVSDFYVMKEY